jgi:hypothetical protein
LAGDDEPNPCDPNIKGCGSHRFTCGGCL